MPVVRTIRTLSALAVAALVGFHGWLFAGQAAAGRLEDPWLVARWLAALVLIGSLVGLRRTGASLWGRQGIAVWTLAALLHGPALAEKNVDLVTLALPETAVAAMVQAAAAMATLLWLLAALVRPRRRHALAPRFVEKLPSLSGSLSIDLDPPFSPRPPPLRS